MRLSSLPIKPRSKTHSFTPRQVLHRIADNLYRSDASGIIYGIVTKDGRQIRRSLKTDNKTVARTRLEKFRAEILESPNTRRDTELATLRFEQLAELWLKSTAATLRPRTAERRRWTIKALAPCFPQTISRVTRADVDKWSAHRSKSIAPATYNKEAETLRLSLDFARERGALPLNPAAHLKRRKIPKPRITVPTPEQFHALLTELRRDYRARGAGDLVEFLAASGCRLGEAVNIRWRDVDFQRATLTIGANGETKNGEARTIPLFPPLRAFLESHKARTRQPDATPDTLLLPTKSAKVALTNCCRRLGLPVFSHHKMRHYFATNCIEQNIPPHIVASWLGHKDGGQLVCRTYGHLRAEASELFAQRVTWQTPANIITLPPQTPTPHTYQLQTAAP